MPFYKSIEKFCDAMILSSNLIPSKRIELLDDLSLIIKRKLKNDEVLNFLFVCTHNSRRSQFANVFGHIAAIYFKLPLLKSYCCGSVETSININTINAFKNIGFTIVASDSHNSNRHYKVFYSEKNYMECYSKDILHRSLPQNNVISLMTCFDADKNCPIISGSIVRFSLPYNDPKIYDNTLECDQQYKNTGIEIAREIFYVFSKLSSF